MLTEGFIMFWQVRQFLYIQLFSNVTFDIFISTRKFSHEYITLQVEIYLSHGSHLHVYQGDRGTGQAIDLRMLCFEN